jgi:hypothetical protein
MTRVGGNALKPGIDGATTPWNPGFMAFAMADFMINLD